MSRHNDLDDFDFDHEEGGVVSQGGGAGIGAVLGIFLTLLVVAGVGYAAFQFGQRRQVTEPPMIAAAEGPAKITPDDPGGTLIPNTDNDAYAMIDGQRPDPSVEAPVYDAAQIEADLPRRDIDPSDAIGAREVRREIVDLGDVEMKSAIDGEPELAEAAAPDRRDERLLAGGADVAVNARSTAESEGGEAGRGVGAASQAGSAAARVSVDTGSGSGSGSTVGDVADAASGMVDAATSAVGSAVSSATDAVAGAAGSLGLGTGSGSGAAPDADAFASAAPDTGAGSNGGDASVFAGAGAASGAFAGNGNEGSLNAQTALSRETEPLTEDSFGPGLRIPAPRMKPSLGASLQAAGARSATPPPERVAMTPPPPPPPPQPAPRAAPAGPAQVQLMGAFANPQQAQARWQQLQGQYPAFLGPLNPRIVPATSSDGRQFYLLRASGDRLRDARMAGQLCHAMGLRGVDCFVPVR